MMKINRKFSINGQKKSYRHMMHNSVLYVYEDILHSKGIDIYPISEESFDVIYARYKELGGRKLFHYDLI